MTPRLASLFAAALALPFVACVGDDAVPLPADEPIAAPATEVVPEPEALPPAAPSARIQNVNVRCLEGRYAIVSFITTSPPTLAELDFVPVLNPPPGGSGPWYTSREVAVYGPCFRMPCAIAGPSRLLWSDGNTTAIASTSPGLAWLFPRATPRGQGPSRRAPRGAPTSPAMACCGLGQTRLAVERVPCAAAYSRGARRSAR